jgi:hypothetical protein
MRRSVVSPQCGNLSLCQLPAALPELPLDACLTADSPPAPSAGRAPCVAGIHLQAVWASGLHTQTVSARSKFVQGFPGHALHSVFASVHKRSAGTNLHHAPQLSAGAGGWRTDCAACLETTAILMWLRLPKQPCGTGAAIASAQ